MDAEDRVIAVLAGRPNDPDWSSVAEGAAEAIRTAGQACSFSKEEASDRRGSFPALAQGWSFGNGQMVCLLSQANSPSNANITRQIAGPLGNSLVNAAALTILFANIFIQRFAGFASSTYHFILFSS